MALILETGASVAGADTYVTVQQLRAYAAKRGATLPATGATGDAACEVLLTKAMDYLQAQEHRYMGERTHFNQPLAWPRFDVEINGYDLDPNSIPDELKSAQMVLAIEAQALDLLPTLDAGAQQGPTTKEKVDVIEVEYAMPAVNRTVTWFAKADALLMKLCSRGGSTLAVTRA